ncbi:hypothetical protein Mchl_1971 [Methylorubrum extorquens CM4]|uniref:SPOR domain-containing protein n=2 Tax=Methylorubrum extorquens TaxID=408 RepID=B7KW06_METC4|nr:hypothetical protein Mchl_1971 [Methylorubrum extorquens CM4]
MLCSWYAGKGLESIASFFAIMFLSFSANALAPGKQTLEALARNARSDQPYAVVISPNSRENVRNRQLEADSYTQRLRELGFAVTTIGPSRRFDADAAIRDLANIPRGSNVAVVVPAPAYADADDIFILAQDSAETATNDTTSMASEALSLSFLSRAISKSRPTQFIVLIPHCRRVDNPQALCPAESLARSGGASVIAANNSNLETDWEGISYDKILPLMTQEGLTYAALYNRISAATTGAGITMSRSLNLSTEFMFAPLNFFQNISTPCNSNRTGAISLTLARARVSACETAVATWPYAREFVQAHEFALEQLAFAETETFCGPLLQSSLAVYRERYPAGSFISQIERRLTDCEKRRVEKGRQKDREAENVRRQDRKQNQADQPQLDSRTSSNVGSWFVIMGSYPSAERFKAVAKQNWLDAQGINAQLIATNNYPGLTSGLTIVSQGPYSKDVAQRRLNQVKSVARDAYIKSAY